MDDLIKRDDALATIDTFKRNFEQPWKVQFSADIRALPAVDLSERIEELERERDGIREVALREAAGLARILGVHPELNTFGGGPEWHQHGKRIAYAIEALIREPK